MDRSPHVEGMQYMQPPRPLSVITPQHYMYMYML